mmetsp:Transcript_31850/g.79013  ORF Transcript_31850/g.79013 Transcript_31850/m.79013 type:complete len:171 (-) Transcript_31850:237-749(-)
MSLKPEDPAFTVWGITLTPMVSFVLTFLLVTCIILGSLVYADKSVMDRFAPQEDRLAMPQDTASRLQLNEGMITHAALRRPGTDVLDLPTDDKRRRDRVSESLPEINATVNKTYQHAGNRTSLSHGTLFEWLLGRPSSLSASLISLKPYIRHDSASDESQELQGEMNSKR